MLRWLIEQFSKEPTKEMIDWFYQRTQRHIDLVKKYAKMIEGYDKERFTGLSERVKEHDSSKFEDSEMLPYVFVSWKYRCKDLGKKFELDKDIEEKMHEATLHHCLTNKHHPEYWSQK